MKLLIFIGLLAVPALAQVFDSPSITEITSFFEMLKAGKSLSFFAVGVLAAQGLFLLFRSRYGASMLGVHQLLVLAILNVLVTVGMKALTGTPILDALFVDASSLMAYQVLAHQIWKQWGKSVKVNSFPDIDKLHDDRNS